jgi:hypothetical protein
MEDNNGCDMLCLFGGGSMVLVNGSIAIGEEEEEEEDTHNTKIVHIEESCVSSGQADDEGLDLNNLVAVKEVTGMGPNKHTAWVPVSNSMDTKHQHKSSVLWYYSNPLTVTDSKDHLKCVHGFSHYNKPSCLSPSLNTLENEDGLITIEDPSATVVECNGMIFLAIIQILELCVDSIIVQTLSAQHLHKPNVHIKAQIMALTYLDSSSNVDWEWTSRFESTGTASHLHNLAGAWIDATNPILRTHTNGKMSGLPTFAFHTCELQAMAAVIYKWVYKEQHDLPTIAATDSFPYRSEGGMWLMPLLSYSNANTVSGSACFVCEKDHSSRLQSDDNCCPCHPTVSVKEPTGPGLIKHMGGHILHDPCLRNRNQPCEFCLNTDGLCVIRLIKCNKTDHIDLNNSQCPSL